MGVRLEAQAQVLRVVDDPLTPRDGLTVDNGAHLQKIGHVRHGLGRGILHADQVKVAALDDELGGGIEQGSGSLMTSRNSKPRRKARVMAAQLEEGQIVSHARLRIDEGSRVDVVADHQSGRVIVDGKPRPAAVLGDDELYFDTNAQSGLVGPGQKDLAVIRRRRPFSVHEQLYFGSRLLA